MHHSNFMLYRGWGIQIRSNGPDHRFHCQLPNSARVIRASQTYSTAQAAIAAAQQRIDLELAQLAATHCYTAFQRGVLPYDDYTTLAELIFHTVPSEVSISS